MLVVSGKLVITSRNITRNFESQKDLLKQEEQAGPGPPKLLMDRVGTKSAGQQHQLHPLKKYKAAFALPKPLFTAAWDWMRVPPLNSVGVEFMESIMQF